MNAKEEKLNKAAIEKGIEEIRKVMDSEHHFIFAFGTAGDGKMVGVTRILGSDREIVSMLATYINERDTHEIIRRALNLTKSEHDNDYPIKDLRDYRA